jgi:hypothetical protein
MEAHARAIKALAEEMKIRSTHDEFPHIPVRKLQKLLLTS